MLFVTGTTPEGFKSRVLHSLVILVSSSIKSYRATETTSYEYDAGTERVETQVKEDRDAYYQS